jgi:hypothetical protein
MFMCKNRDIFYSVYTVQDSLIADLYKPPSSLMGSQKVFFFLWCSSVKSYGNARRVVTIFIPRIFGQIDG